MKAEASDHIRKSGAACESDCAFLYGAHIVMTGYAGAAGTVSLATADTDRLKKRFSPSYIDRILKVPVLSGEEQIPEALYVFCAGDGGVYAALWYLGEELKCGMEVKHKEIPILQETIEVCNLQDINPYMLDSQGCMLMVTNHPKEMIEELVEAGIPAADIGCLTSDRKRVIINGENIRFLNKPGAYVSDRPLTANEE